VPSDLEVHIKSQGMFLALVNCFWVLVLETLPRKEEKKWRRISYVQSNQHQPVVHRTVSGAQAGPATNSALSGKSEGAATIIHRAVRCSPDCPSSIPLSHR
jgi:hypothetical protein